MADENSPVRRSPLRRWLLVVIAVFVAATGAFGALWFNERGDHKTATDQLNAVRTEVQDAKNKLTTMEKRHIDVQNRITKAEQEIQKHQADVAANKPCTDVGLEMVRSKDEAVIRAATPQLQARCR